MENNNIIDIRRFNRAVKKIWWLYLIAIAICVGAAGFYLSRSLTKTPVLGEMLIGEESMTDGGAGALAAAKGAGGMSQMLKTFSIGGFGGAAVDNEMLILSSHDVMERTVKTLGLNRTYIGKTETGEKAMLWPASPIKVEAPAEFFDTLTTAFNLKIKLLPGGKANIKATKGMLGRTIAEAKDVKLPAMFKTPLGNLQILRGESFDSSPYKQITVNISGNNLAAINLSKEVEVNIISKLADVIELEYKCANVELGKAVVNGIMNEYNVKRLDRIHETAVNSIKYYDERIAETLKQLESAEQKVADYKRSTSMSAIEAEAKLIAQMTTQGKAELLEAQNTIDYYQHVIASLRDNLNNDVLIPQAQLLGDSTLTKYNELILQRRDLRRSAHENNTSLLQLNQKISSLADLIQANANQFISRAKNQLQSQMQIAGMANNRLNQYPEMELDYTVLARNQEFQNALYLYLVQARENAVLKMYADTDLGFVFQPAYVDKPGLPVKSILIILAAFIFAVVGSSFIALIVLWRSQKVMAPMDVAFMHIDTRAINYDGSQEQMARMRTMLMANPEQRTIYVCDFNSGATVYPEIVKSFADTGCNVTEISAENNSLLLSPEVSEKIKTAINTGNYVLISVPEPKELFILENSIDLDFSELLIAVPDSMRRSELKKLLKGQTTDKVFTLILTK